MKLRINVVICNLCKSAILFQPFSICDDPYLAYDQALIIIGARRAFLRPRKTWDESGRTLVLIISVRPRAHLVLSASEEMPVPKR